MSINNGSPEGGRDLFEQFKSMSIKELSAYSSAFNIYLSNGKKEGILVGFMEMEPSPERVKVLTDQDFEYWTENESTYARAENRKWK